MAMVTKVELREKIRNHPAYPGQVLVLGKATKDFKCKGCKQRGSPGRIGYRVEGQGSDVKLHACCAVKPDTLTHRRYGDNIFRFHPAGRKGRKCKLCGKPVPGFVYHCPEKDADLHPCCALCRRNSRTCPCTDAGKKNNTVNRIRA